jgi:hypothetical protein
VSWDAECGWSISYVGLWQGNVATAAGYDGMHLEAARRLALAATAARAARPLRPPAFLPLTFFLSLSCPVLSSPPWHPASAGR